MKSKLVFVWLIFSFFSQMSVAQTTAPVLEVEPSSVIPLKRLYPLNENINACENFHQYVCSKVESSFKLRDDRNRHMFSFHDSSERILEAKKEFFKNLPQQKNQDSRARQIRDVYLACMDEKAGVNNEITEFKKLKSEIASINTIDKFIKLQTQKIAQGSDSLLSFSASNNQDNPSINDIFIYARFMNLPQYSYYENQELMNEYRQIIFEFFRILSPELSAEKTHERVEQVIKLEKSFVDVYPHPEILRQRWGEKRQVKQEDFIKKYSNIGVETLIKKTPNHLLISNYIPESLDFYSQVLKPENLEALKDFYLYTYGRSYLDDSRPDFFKKYFEFSAKFLGGALARPDRHERCTKHASGAFLKETDQILINKLFPKFPEAKFREVAAKIRESVIRGIENNTWLQPESKAKAILKMQKAKMYLVKPQNEREWDFVEIKKYSQTDRFANARLYAKTNFEKNLKLFKEGANLEAWSMGPLTVNAYYDFSSNKFVMPMGILQYPFFNGDGDLIENLGAVGAVIGHELGHGIDDQGSKYDEVGRLQQWMTMKDLKEFSDRGKKLIEQFNQAGHNGMLTLGENIGDLVGLTFAYNAAFPEGKGTIEDKKKLFISYARTWCGVARPKAEEQLLKTDPHALGRARINEQVKHQKAFAEAFACKKNDKMTLPDEERVKIW